MSDLDIRERFKGFLENEKMMGMQDVLPIHLDSKEAKADDAEWKKLKKNVLNCRKCELCENRNNVVFGDGNEQADLMFVGEAPGADEDAQGFPFVGRAGKLLTKIIESIGLNRKDVYICNVIKCRPPQNRTPFPHEIEKCHPYLEAQINYIKPKIICTLGSPAAKTVLGTEETISHIRGQVFHRQDTIVIPTYHPAYLLRNPAMKRPVWEDMKLIRKLLNE
ncbi:uracil-DNA glycosylase [PVC group bacterium]|nr:uracil-DNA glycosylase [PVC group bacterium]